jgi:hypothetical protein
MVSSIARVNLLSKVSKESYTGKSMRLKLFSSYYIIGAK